MAVETEKSRLSTGELEQNPENPSFPLTIEPLQEKDIPQFRDLIISGIGSKVHLQELTKKFEIQKRGTSYYQRELNRDDRLFFCVKNDIGEVVGALESRFKETDEGKAGFIEIVSVMPEYQGQGVATSLYKKYESHLLCREDISLLISYVENGNEPSKKLHEKFGLSNIYVLGETGNWYFKRLSSEL